MDNVCIDMRLYRKSKQNYFYFRFITLNPYISTGSMTEGLLFVQLSSFCTNKFPSFGGLGVVKSPSKEI